MIIFVTLNGKLFKFDNIKELQLKVKSYGKDLESIKLAVSMDNTLDDKIYEFSILSACYFISTGKLPEKSYSTDKKIKIDNSILGKMRKKFIPKKKKSKINSEYLNNYE